MSDALFARHVPQAARRGSLSRREVLERGLKLGTSTAAITTLMAAAPEVGASAATGKSPLSWPALRARRTGTFTIIGDESSPELGPAFRL